MAGFGLVCCRCYWHYSLTREKHAEILVELDRRAAKKAKEAADPS